MKRLFHVLFCVIIVACNNSENNSESETERRQYLPERNPVDIIVLERSTFQKELVSNGKLKARQKSVLKFETGEELIELRVKNGDKVSSGQLIARLRQDKLLRQLEQARTRLSQAYFELQEYLIGQGYSIDDTTTIPEERYDMACIRTGYTAAKSEFELTQLNYNGTDLRAPFSGVIANIDYRLHEQVSAGAEFCTLIDNNQFEVEFPILEAELNEVSVGKSVKVIPFSTGDTLINGTISEINPMVDENGMIEVTAILKQTGNLLDGMNVQVLLETAVPGQLVVPKSAVLLRDNQEVLFKKVAGQAYWTYIQTELENSTSYAVIAHPEKGATLEPGDSVIISGNLNLAHESDVILR